MQLTPLEPWIATKIGLINQPLTRSALDAWQLEKLNESLQLVKNKSRFYREHLQGYPQALKNLGELSRLPMTTAQDLARNPLSFVCVSQDEISRVVTLQTSGTSGEPKRLFFTAEDQKLTIDFFGVGMSTFTSPAERVLILLPAEKPGSVGDLLRQGLQKVGRLALPYGPVRDPQQALEQIDQNKVDCLVGSPTQVLGLALRWQPGQHRPKSVLLSTDYVPQAILHTLQLIWGCSVYNHYGSTEMGLGGGVQCAALQGYHLREADLFFEIIDPHSGQIMPPGEYGEVVFTTLTRRGMPLIRYRMGDRARMLPGDCPCGSQLCSMETVSGRWEGFIPLRNETLRLADLDEALFGLPGLLDFSATLQGLNGKDQLQLDLSWLYMEDRDARVEDALQEVPALNALELRVNHHHVPAYPGSLRKRVIQDKRNNSAE